MSDTPQLNLPLLASAQAQKHVTVNEALVRLDAMAQPVALSADLTSPPAAVDGDAYIVAAAPTGAWAGQAGTFAVFDNGGWIFLTPRQGWRVWVADRREDAIFVDGEWIGALTGGAALGAHTAIRADGADVTLTGPSVSTALTIPDRAVVIGVTARVISAVTGAGVTGWRIGVAGFDDRYGKLIGLTSGSSSNGVTGAPVAYFADTPLLITAEGGAFDGGQVRLAVHYFDLAPPNSI